MTPASDPDQWRSNIAGNREHESRPFLANDERSETDNRVRAEDGVEPKPFLGPPVPHPSRTPSSLPSRQLKLRRRLRPAKTNLPAGTIGLAEWHVLTPSEAETAWAQLKEWVVWLHDRYELSVETRLPRCWTQHPGLVEELWSLKSWREEVYSSDQPGGQAARYWHTELRNFVTTGIGFYARNCRTGHKNDGIISAASVELRDAWDIGDPMAGVPAAMLAKHQPQNAPGTSRFIAESDMTALLDAGKATYTSVTLREHVKHDGSWWHIDPAAPHGWTRITDARYAKLLDARAAAMAGPDSYIRRSRALHVTASSAPVHGTAQAGG